MEKRVWCDAPVGSELERKALASLAKITADEKKSAAMGVLKELGEQASLRGSYPPFFAERHRLYTIAHAAVAAATTWDGEDDNY